jgi:HPt (histidine-containing phosphotransfer) domain-containing protein
MAQNYRMSVLDRAHFEHMTGDDPALQAEIVALFRSQVGEWNAGLAGADWRDAVHKLKGSARGIGLDVLASACEAAERAGPQDAPSTLSRVRAALEEALSVLTPFAADAA